MKKIVSTFALLGCLTLFLSSCSSTGLDRDKAKELIEEFYKYPNVELRDFNLHLTSKNRENYQNIIAEGYLIHTGYNNLITSDIAEPYKGWTKGLTDFAMNLRFFKEVTGIRYENDDKTKAVVEFSVERRNVTPFGQAQGTKEGDIGMYSVECQKYDDGWRITTKEKYEIRTAEDFPGVVEFTDGADQPKKRHPMDTVSFMD